MIYVPVEWEGRTREWLARYQHVRKVLEQLCEACVMRLTCREE